MTLNIKFRPETYAMMLAGLGLMGFVAKRRMANRA
ncbi:MAG TPA: PEP-CTERM sorting domain-containing protein [Methylophilaceae bacterium]|nr:PEP-CTERM sorting domain-containing protein [Methylophilaceae bacterium]